MRPAKEFRAAREAFRRDQQSCTFFDPLIIFAMRYQKLIARKKLCGPFTQRQLTKWPAVANRFVTPEFEH